MSKVLRVLSLYSRLLEGKLLIKREEAFRFCVDERTVQRDLDDIRAYLAEGRPDLELIYHRDRKGYLIKRKQSENKPS